MRSCFCFCAAQCPLPCAELFCYSCEDCLFSGTMMYAAWAMKLNLSRIALPIMGGIERILDM